MVLAIAYPSTAAGDPHRLSTQKIASIASDIRIRLFGIQPRPVDVAALIAKTARLVVNGKPITLSWGLDRPIHDENGHEALGVCENDPYLPYKASEGSSAGPLSWRRSRNRAFMAAITNISLTLASITTLEPLKPSISKQQWPNIALQGTLRLSAARP